MLLTQGYFTKKDCFNIVFNFGDKIKIKDNGVYIIKNGEEIEIEKPLKQKKMV